MNKTKYYYKINYVLIGNFVSFGQLWLNTYFLSYLTEI